MITQIAVRTQDSGMIFLLNEDNEWKCDHLANGAYIEKACCKGSSAQHCDCGGLDAVVCPAPDCTGIEVWEIEKLMEDLG